MNIHFAKAIRNPDSGANPIVGFDHKPACKNNNKWFAIDCSGETIHSFISCPDVGVNTYHLKTGSDSRDKQIGKLNQLLLIGHKSGTASLFARKAAVKECQIL